jgi:hypothetical protein
VGPAPQPALPHAAGLAPGGAAERARLRLKAAYGILALTGLLAETGRLPLGAMLRPVAPSGDVAGFPDAHLVRLLPCEILVGAPGEAERPLADLLNRAFSRDWVRRNLAARTDRVPLAIAAAESRLDPGPAGFAELLAQTAQVVARRASPPLAAYWTRLVPGVLAATGRAASRLETEREALTPTCREAIRAVLQAYADPRTPRGVAIEEMAHRMAALRISESGL